MEILGELDDGILVVPVARLLLTNTADRFSFPLAAFSSDDRAALIDNPTTKFSAILVHTSSVFAKKITDLGLVCTFQFIRLNDDTIEIDVTGQARVKIHKTKTVRGRIIALEVSQIKYVVNNKTEIETMMDEITDHIMEADEEIGTLLKNTVNMSEYADMILDEMLPEKDNRKLALNTISVLKRMRSAHMAVLGSEDKEDGDAKLKSSNKDIQTLIDKFEKLTLKKKANEEIGATLRTLSKMNPSASEYPTQLRYAEFALSLPWTKMTTDNPIADVEKALEVSHYGMDKAKERLIEHMAIKSANPKFKGMTVLLDGPPGTGKTTLALALGKAMGRKVERLSLGGCADPSFFKGHGRTYSGSRYGRIMQAMHSSGVKNPIIVLDEVEKVTDGIQGSATATLLEILDPKTNTEFTDNYLGFDFDLSEVIFIATSNDRHAISPPVLDRMEYIACDGYTMTEKIKIATDYTIPTITKELGIEGTKVSKKLITHLIEGYTRESGVRGLEKALNSCLRKVAVEKTKGKTIKVNKKLIEKRLGQRYEETKPMSHTEPGIVTGLYYSTDGGGALDVEGIITNLDGTGQLTVTGQCGDVMVESIKLVRAHMTAADYGMDGENLATWDLHVHMPAGATPKDGPSAGGAYALLFASLLMNKPIKEGLCLTGECNLHGHITPIGGVDQKVAGAVRLGYTTVCLPKGNKRDYDELPKHLKEAAEFHFISNVEELLDIAFDYEDMAEVIV